MTRVLVGDAVVVDVAGHDAELGVVTCGEPRDTHPLEPIDRAVGGRRTTVGACGDRSASSTAWRGARRGARRAGRRLGRSRTSSAAAQRHQAPGPRLPVHLLLPAPRRPAALAPGLRRRAARCAGVRRQRGYRVVHVDRTPRGAGQGPTAGTIRLAGPPRSQLPLVESIRRLLVATAGRTPTLGCFGLHEWAMVHRQPRRTRSGTTGRCGSATPGTDEVVESHRIACSHFDAFRFFTDSARPLNTLQPGRDDRPTFEQPGCLHAGMDLYKHAFRLTPAGRLRAGRRLLRAGLGHPRARHARLAVRLQRPGLRAGPHRDGRPASRSTSPPSAPSPSAALPCASG